MVLNSIIDRRKNFLSKEKWDMTEQFELTLQVAPWIIGHPTAYD